MEKNTSKNVNETSLQVDETFYQSNSITTKEMLNPKTVNPLNHEVSAGNTQSVSVSNTNPDPDNASGSCITQNEYMDMSAFSTQRIIWKANHSIDVPPGYEHEEQWKQLKSRLIQLRKDSKREEQ